MPDVYTLPPLTFKKLSAANGLPMMVEAVQYNFDQVLLYGGGPPGRPGKQGDKGLPGATGNGKKGDPGTRGSQMYFYASPIANGTLVNSLTVDANQLQNDVVIDSNGDYLKIEKVGSDLKYVFKFNINIASVTSYIISQTDYAAGAVVGAVDEWILKDGGVSLTDMNLLLAKRSAHTGSNDKSEFYRFGVGIDSYVSQNASVIITNIPSPTNLSPNVSTDEFFAQLGFKYRQDELSNISGNTSWVIYKEGPTIHKTYFQLINSSASIHLVHNTFSSVGSVIMTGENFEILGTTSDPDVIVPDQFLGFGVTLGNSFITPYKNLVSYPLGFDPLSQATFLYGKFAIGRFLPGFYNFVVDIDTDDFILKANNMDLGRSGTPLAIELVSDTTVNSASSKKLTINTQTAIFNKFSLGRSPSVSASGGILDITNYPYTVFNVQPGTNSTLTTINGGVDQQIIVIRNYNFGSSWYVAHNIGLNGINLTHKAKMVLLAGECLTLQFFNGIWYQIGDSKKLDECIRLFQVADISSDFDNLRIPGFYQAQENTLISNSSIVYSTSQKPFIRVEGEDSGVTIQTQHNIDTDDVDIWTRRYRPSVGVWENWYQHAFTNKEQAYTKQQRFALSTYFDHTSLNAFTGGNWRPHENGNSYLADSAVIINPIDLIYNLGEGTTLRLHNGNSSPITLSINTPASGSFLPIKIAGTGIISAIVAGDFVLYPDYTITLHLNGGVWWITEYSDSLTDDITIMAAELANIHGAWTSATLTGAEVMVFNGTINVFTTCNISYKIVGKTVYFRLFFDFTISTVAWGYISFNLISLFGPTLNDGFNQVCACTLFQTANATAPTEIVAASSNLLVHCPTGFSHTGVVGSVNGTIEIA